MVYQTITADHKLSRDELSFLLLRNNYISVLKQMLNINIIKLFTNQSRSDRTFFSYPSYF